MVKPLLFWPVSGECWSGQPGSYNLKTVMTKESCISDNYAKCNRFDRHCVGQQWTNFVYELGTTQIFCSLLIGSLSDNDATATKTSLKKRISAASNFIALIPSHLKLLCQVLAIVLKCMNSKGLYQSSGKEKRSCCLVLPSSTKREFRHFHVVVVQRR